MSDSKIIVCLANSRMNDACTIVGRELKNNSVGDWVRITDTKEGHIEFKNAKCTDGTMPKTLDVISVSLKKYTPSSHQTENWLIDENEEMEKIDKVKKNELDSFLDQRWNLWTFDKNQHETDRVTHVTMSVHKIRNSLQFIRVSDLILKVDKSPYGGRKLRHRAKFSYQGIEYDLAVTDKITEDRYDEIGEYDIDECYITIGLTLTDTVHGFFKLALAIIPID